MKLSVTQENFARALSNVARVASSKTPLPILSNILIKTEKNRLLLAATNLELAVTEYIGAKVEQTGDITVPSRLITEFIAQLPKGNIELTVEDSKLQIKSGNYNSTINGTATDEFPALPDISGDKSIKLDAAILKKAIAQTTPVVSRDNTRPVLTGVYCHSLDGQLYFAATDGYRLAERSLGAAPFEISAIIPASTLQEVVRVAEDSLDMISVLFDENQVRFLLGNTEVTSRLIDGVFPDYRKLIPTTSDSSATLAKDDFMRVTKISSLFARESGGSVTIRLEKGSLSIHSIASQLGENTSTTEATVKGGGTVTLNSRYLIEALSAVEEDEISFSFSGKIAPCVIKSTSKTPNYQHIIMPLKS